MIHYNVWFSFKAGVDDAQGLSSVSTFLDDLARRGLIQRYRLMRHRPGSGTTRLAPFHVSITFTDDEQFGRPFAEVGAAGYRMGLHGAMFALVDTFIVEIFEDIDLRT